MTKTTEPRNVVAVRLSRDELGMAKDLAALDGAPVSVAIRIAIRRQHEARSKEMKKKLKK
jgi:hypothetical protein